jgi:hypothetical protein
VLEETVSKRRLTMSDMIGHGESQDNAAIAIALEVGLLQACAIHEDSIFPGHNDVLEDAYKLASARFKAGDKHLTSLFSSQMELTDRIKHVVEIRDGDECGSCNSPGNS